jgi:hypothetical protein
MPESRGPATCHGLSILWARWEQHVPESRLIALGMPPGPFEGRTPGPNGGLAKADAEPSASSTKPSHESEGRRRLEAEARAGRSLERVPG